MSTPTELSKRARAVLRVCPDAEQRLYRREYVVLQMHASGSTLKEIAAFLDISAPRVRQIELDTISRLLRTAHSPESFYRFERWGRPWGQ